MTRSPAIPPSTGAPVADLQHLSGENVNNDNLLACLLAILHHHGRRFDAASLVAGLPLQGGKLTPRLFTRAARKGGINAKVVDRKAADISPHTCPCVVLMKDGTAAVLQSIQPGQGAQGQGVKSFDIHTPLTDELVTYPTQHDFEADYAGTLILCKPSLLQEMAPDLYASGAGWFFDTLKQFWRLYAQVALAAILINIFMLVAPLFIMNVYDRVVPNAGFSTLWVLAIGAFSAFLFDFILRQLRSYFIDVAGRGADILLTSQIYQQIMNVRLGVNRRMSSGMLANQVREFETLRDFMTSSTLVTLIDLPFVFLFIAVIALLAGPVAWVPLLAIPIVLLVSFAVQWPLRNMVGQYSEDVDAKHGHLVESIGALEVIKSLGLSGQALARWETLCGAVARLGLKARFLSSLGVHFALFVQNIVSIGVIIWGVYLVTDGQITVGALVAATTLAGRAMAPLGQAVGLFVRYQQAKSALKKLDELMQAEVERPDGQQFVTLGTFKGQFQLSDVSFSYPGSPMESLNHVSFTIQPGEKVAIVGRIGSGKSTLLRMLLNLYNPTKGQVLVDGVEVRQIDPAALRAQIAYVPQANMLFRGTLRENVLIAKSTASENEFLNACQLSGVSEFVRRHPLGFDMPVGERGEFLSGGQRQAVALARAMLKGGNVVVLDDPTSEMDSRSEEHVKASLRDWLVGKTVILITHRGTMLDIVDRMLVMDYGRLLVDGPKEAVLEKLKTGITAKA